MGLETGTYISDLNVANPVGTDAKSQGDDHIRLVKSTIKTTFPNITGAVTKTHTQLNDGLEKAGGTMTGQVKGITPVAAEDLTRKDYVDGMTQGPAFRAYRSTVKTLTASFVDIEFDTEEFDTASCYNTSTGVFTPNVAGYYSIQANIQITGTGVTGCGLHLSKNNAYNAGAQIYLGTFSGTTGGGGISTLLYMNGTTDNVRLKAAAWATSGQATRSGEPYYCTFTGHMVRKA